MRLRSGGGSLWVSKGIPRWLSARLAGRVCVVTAGLQGLGRAIATRLAAHGARVAYNGRSTESLTTTAAERTEFGGADQLPVVRDVADEAAVVALAPTFVIFG